MRQQLPEYTEGKETEVAVDRNTNFAAQIMTTGSLKQSFAFGAVYELSKTRYRFNRIFSDALKNGTERTLGLRFRYYRNSQDNRNYPTRGAEGLLESVFHFDNKLKINLKAGFDTVDVNLDGVIVSLPKDVLDGLAETLTPDPYITLLGRYSKFLKITPGFQLKPEFAGALIVTNNSAEKSFQEFFVGGYQNIRFNDTNFWGLNYGEVKTSNFVKAGLTTQFIPIKKVYLRAGINYLGFSKAYRFQEEGFINSIFKDETYAGYGLDMTYQSILGPITIGVSSNNKDNKLRSYFSLGYSFNYSDR